MPSPSEKNRDWAYLPSVYAGVVAFLGGLGAAATGNGLGDLDDWWVWLVAIIVGVLAAGGVYGFIHAMAERE